MTFDRDKFAEEIGNSFTLKQPDGSSIDLELVEVTEAKERPHQISFAIILLAPKSLPIDQGLYDLHNDRLGDMQIFLVPIGIVDERMQLEAVFNLVREASESNG